MAVKSDKTTSPVEPAHDVHTAPANGNQTSLACLTTYASSAVLFYGYVYGQLGVLGRKVHALEEQLDRLGASIEQQGRQHDEHVAILAACQRDTAIVLNHELDRHALHPAVEAVVALAEELSHLNDCASQLPNVSVDGDGVDRLRAEMDISCSVAREKLANLDVQRITPAEGEQLDPKVHTVCGYVEMVDKNLHGRISKVVTPGIAYRGKVLRPARVLVFRMRTSDGQNKRKESVWTKEES
jgi:molecular chaperone GrpE (heat shock protein)